MNAIPVRLSGPGLSRIPQVIIAALILAALYLLSTFNYLIFHSIVELAGIAVAYAIFIIVWNTRKTISSTFFLIVGISFLFTGTIDLVHTLAYKGMGVFPGATADLPTQLWIAARYFQGITFLIATLFIGRSISKDRKYDTPIIFTACAVACGLLFASIFVWHNFPSCFIDGSGLTPFKIYSEYVISAILVATAVLLYYKRKFFEPDVWHYLVVAVIFLILGELAFTSYISVYGFMNMLGHLFRLISVYLFYRAFVVVSLSRPYDLIYRELRQKNDALRESEKKYRLLFENMLDGFAYCRMLYDQNGQPEDFLYLDVNPAFEQIVGLGDVSGKRSTEVFPGIREEFPELFEVYGRVALSGTPESFDIEFAPISKWLHISVYSPAKEHFVAVFEDITHRKEMELEIAAAQERVKDAHRLAKIGTWSWVVETDTVIWSEELYRIAGRDLSLPAPSYAEHSRVYAPESWDRLSAAVARALETGEPYNLELELVRPDGSIRWVNAFGGLARDRSGQVTGLHGTLQDITDRKQAEEALRLKDFAIVSSINAIAISDLSGTLTYINPAFLSFWGYQDPHDVIGRPVLSFWKNPDDAQQVVDSLQKQKTWSGELTALKKDGSLLPVQLSANLIYNASGTPIGMLASFIDITDRKAAEDALAKSEYLFHTMADWTFDWEYWKDPDRNVLYVSPSVEWITGYSDKEFVADAGLVDRIIHPDDRALWEEHVRLHQPGVQPHITAEVEFRIIRRDGSTRWIAHVCRSILTEGGTFAGTRVSNRDITDRKRAEDALALASKKLDLLSSITRHDILNQVTVLLGYIDILSDESLTPELTEYLHHMDIAARTIQRQIEFTREYRELGVQAPVWLNISELVMEGEAGLPMDDIRLSMNRTDVEVFGDKLLGKVFYNLIDNALRYGGKQMTTITVTAYEEDHSLVILFADNGAGIPDEDKQKLFKKGFGKNTGLGLFLSREILAITGITITEDGEPGKGARFRMTVPKGSYRFPGAGEHPV
ncbi:MAG: sensory histidine kinase AtoS [Methanoregulaceae archaeon PtaB.Bin108]|nr:MAG: sensory histidine kinase AtoS [Methanoregulaceae archaeon PtaB.Bin108]